MVQFYAPHGQHLRTLKVPPSTCHRPVSPSTCHLRTLKVPPSTCHRPVPPSTCHRPVSPSTCHRPVPPSTCHAIALPRRASVSISLLLLCDNTCNPQVPGSGIASLSWEGGSLRIALAVDSYIYFANIRPDYRWGFFGETLVCAYAQPEKIEASVLFWNTKSDERHVKSVKRLLAIRASKENCVLATKVITTVTTITTTTTAVSTTTTTEIKKEKSRCGEYRFYWVHGV